MTLIKLRLNELTALRQMFDVLTKNVNFLIKFIILTKRLNTTCGLSDLNLEIARFMIFYTK